RSSGLNRSPSGADRNTARAASPIERYLSRPDRYAAMKSPRFSSHLFRASEKGASLVEYSLLVAFIALVAWAAIAAVGDETSATFAAAAASIGGISGDGVEAGGPVGVGGEAAGSGTLPDSDGDGADALGGAGGAPAGDADANRDLDHG